MKYANLLIEKRYLAIALFLMIVSVFTWGSYVLPEKYEANSTIYIERNIIESLVKGIAMTPSIDDKIRILRDTMLSRNAVLNVLKKMDLDMRTKGDKELEKMITRYQDKTKIKIAKGLITVSFTHQNPRIARDYINNIINEYVEQNLSQKREEVFAASDFLKKQLDFFKDRIDQGEKKIIEFRQQQGVYISLNEGLIIKEIKDYEKAIEDLNVRKQELYGERKSIARQLKGEEPYTVTMISEKGSLMTLENRLAQLLVKYTENYPEVIRLKAEIEALKSQNVNNTTVGTDGQAGSVISAINPIYQDLKQRLNKSDADISALTEKEKQLRTLINQKQEELRNIPVSRKKLADLEGELTSYKNVYDQLLVRLGQSEVTKQMEIEDKATTFRIIEPAIIPKVPVSPNRKMIMIFGIIMGLVGAFGLIYLIDLIDESIKTAGSLKDFGLPILAMISRMHDSRTDVKEKNRDMIVFGCAGLYMVLILGLLVMELLGLTFVRDSIHSAIYGRYI